MKVELKKYEGKYFFKFAFNLLNFKILKSAGFFQKRFFKRFFKSIFKKDTKKIWKYVVLADGKVVGGFDFYELSPGKFNVGVIIFKKYWNQGIATKATKKLFVIAKKKGAKKILSVIDKSNLASIKLAKKLGSKKIRESKKEIFWEKKLK